MADLVGRTLETAVVQRSQVSSSWMVDTPGHADSDGLGVRAAVPLHGQLPDGATRA